MSRSSFRLHSLYDSVLLSFYFQRTTNKHIHNTYIYIYIYIHIKWRANSFIQHALKLSETPFPLRLLDMILPSRWSNFCAANPFNIISLLVRGNYSASFSMGIVRSSWSRLLRYSATPCMMSLRSACCIEEAFVDKHFLHRRVCIYIYIYIYIVTPRCTSCSSPSSSSASRGCPPRSPSSSAPSPRSSAADYIYIYIYTYVVHML